MNGDVIDMQAEFYRNIELLCGCADKRGLQIAAMNDPVGRAVARRGRLPQRYPHDFAAGFAIEDAKARRLDHLRPQPLFQAEVDQRARRVGRKLNAGAGFLKPLGLLQHDDAKAAARQRQCRSQSADSGTCDNNARRREDGCSVTGQAALRQAHCAGCASFGASAGSCR